MADEDADKLTAEAFRRHSREVYRFLYRRTGHAADAEDLTQKVFAEAALALRAGSRPDSWLAWLYTVAERRFIDYVRRLKTHPPESLLLDSVADPRDLEYQPSIASALKAELELLPEEQRRVIVMKLFEGRPFAEIATRLGTTEAAAKMRFSRGLAQLRTQLRDRGVEP